MPKKLGFIPIILLIPIAIASFISIVVLTISSSQNTTLKTVTSLPLPALDPSPSPSPTPTPIPTPKPSPTPSPSSLPKPSPSTSQSTSTNTTVKSYGNFSVLTFDLASITVVTDTANDSDCSNNCPTKPLAPYVTENGGRAGMNGTYFCPQDYESCASKVNSFDFAVWNNRQKKWINSSTLFWNGRGMFVFRSGSAQFFPDQSKVGAPSDITGGIVNYPSLIAGGQIVLDHGILSDKQKAKGTKTGIGTGQGKLFLVVAYSADMDDMVRIFQSLGATDALNLDGGGSAALYNGGYVSGPGRNLPNAIIIK